MKEFIFSMFEGLADLGYFGIAIGLMIEMIPSEIVLGYGGYLVSLGRIGFAGAVAAGVIGGTLAQLFLYWLGYYGGRPILEKYGKYLLVNKKHLDLSEQWFGKYGTGVIFFARFIPVVRHAISIPAGVAKMPVWKFTVYTVAAMIPWTILFLILGIQLGSNWMHIKEAAQPYMIPLIIIFLMVIAVYLFAKSANKRKTA
ncbi:DedA family protein [Metabacillus sp. 84]|uniref:DedA family protein n=1 Tax=Metabacillus sp. 84 TaxID=3404705 RepID=UPI003CEDD67D